MKHPTSVSRRTRSFRRQRGPQIAAGLSSIGEDPHPRASLEEAREEGPTRRADLPSAPRACLWHPHRRSGHAQAAGGQTTIAGWQVILRASRAGDTLIAGVTFIAESTTIMPQSGPPEGRGPDHRPANGGQAEPYRTAREIAHHPSRRAPVENADAAGPGGGAAPRRPRFASRRDPVAPLNSTTSLTIAFLSPMIGVGGAVCSSSISCLFLQISLGE